MKRNLSIVAVAIIFLMASMAVVKADEDGWTTNYKKALAQAKSENKLMLLDFTGSDWCEGCIQMHKEVFAQPKFKEYAQKHFVLVEVDFPMGKPQTDEVKNQNKDLSEKFQVGDLIPTIVIVNGDGKKVGQFVGYMPGGPDAFLAEVDKAIKK